MSRIMQELTLPVHGDLLETINQTVVDIKVHNDEKPLMVEMQTLNALREKHRKPTLEEICHLLQRCHKAINEQRFTPRKY